MSGHKNARSQRSLAVYHLAREHWEEANKHFELALAINPLFPDSWFSNGCAYMFREKWPEALQSFTRCVQVSCPPSPLR